MMLILDHDKNDARLLVGLQFFPGVFPPNFFQSFSPDFAPKIEEITLYDAVFGPR